MTELRDGLILTQSKVAAGNFTHNGKPIELKQDENNPLLYSAQEKLSEEEKKAGNQEFAFYLNFGEAEGTLRKVLSPSALDQHPDFKDLNDAEKVTKLNSIQYQYGAEPTDIGKGLDEVLQTSVNVPKQNENFAESRQQQHTAETREHAADTLREREKTREGGERSEREGGSETRPAPSPAPAGAQTTASSSSSSTTNTDSSKQATATVKKNSEDVNTVKSGDKVQVSKQ